MDNVVKGKFKKEVKQDDFRDMTLGDFFPEFCFGEDGSINTADMVTWVTYMTEVDQRLSGYTGSAPSLAVKEAVIDGVTKAASQQENREAMFAEDAE